MFPPEPAKRRLCAALGDPRPSAPSAPFASALRTGTFPPPSPLAPAESRPRGTLPHRVPEGAERNFFYLQNNATVPFRVGAAGTRARCILHGTAGECNQFSLQRKPATGTSCKRREGVVSVPKIDIYTGIVNTHAQCNAQCLSRVSAEILRHHAIVALAERRRTNRLNRQ